MPSLNVEFFEKKSPPGSIILCYVLFMLKIKWDLYIRGFQPGFITILYILKLFERECPPDFVGAVRLYNEKDKYISTYSIIKHKRLHQLVMILYIYFRKGALLSCKNIKI